MTWKPGQWNSHRHSNKKKKEVKKVKNSLRNVWKNIKWNVFALKGVPEGEEREKRTENLSEEIMAEKFPNLDPGGTESSK